MQSTVGDEEWLLDQFLTQPAKQNYRFTEGSDHNLRQILFLSLAAHNNDYLALLFPNGTPQGFSEPWSLKMAQGAQDGAEYTEGARGTACGHIFRSGESTYSCRTCAADETCVLCSRCFKASDHEDHKVFISVSPGNSGCCDCGDREAWQKEVLCAIHSTEDELQPTQSRENRGKGKAQVSDSTLPPDFVEAIRMTIARAVNYVCDVLSCSPEQMRLPKTVESIKSDYDSSRLGKEYGSGDRQDHSPEFALVLWNDEKHSVIEVANQVARACSAKRTVGHQKAKEVDEVGRSIVLYSTDLEDLLHMAGILEQIKVTVTIRSARDTFREQMCATIVDWISDIAGCAVGQDTGILRRVLCEELLNPWQKWSRAGNQDIGQEGIHDHELEDQEWDSRVRRRNAMPVHFIPVDTQPVTNVDEDGDEDGGEDGGEGGGEGGEGFEDEDDDQNTLENTLDDELVSTHEDDEMEIDEDDFRRMAADSAERQRDLLAESDNIMEEARGATFSGYPHPPNPSQRAQQRGTGPPPGDSEHREADRAQAPNPFESVPRTPRIRPLAMKAGERQSKHWLEKPKGFARPRPNTPSEDIWQRVRLDYLILYDLRLWKTLRTNLRHLYITTVVMIPQFKRILGLRFAGLYTSLAQLYLIADREPDHSIINLSVQMLTTPSITEEVMERGNFLTNLMAILYTFLTTRQVDFPEKVLPHATLAFDAGALTNRRMFHFFYDLRWLFHSKLVQDRMRVEQRYMLQFLDLIKLHQGVCPNVRAVVQHVEWESDTWVSAQLLVKEINKLCKLVAVSFEPQVNPGDGNVHLRRALRTVAQVTMINAFGYERTRFEHAEPTEDMEWHVVGPFEPSEYDASDFSVPLFDVLADRMSFHHPLHYLLSWLIENASGTNRQEMRAILHFTHHDLRDPWTRTRTRAAPSNLAPDELLCAIFDHPLRVCVWLAHIKAGLWVRNGVTLRHQAHTYRGISHGVSHPDVAYQRDIFMIQAGLVLCGSDEHREGERFLAQMIDRFQLVNWVCGDYAPAHGTEDAQLLEIVEDFFHLLIIALSERGNLLPKSEDQGQQDRILEHDIAHALCFRPLSFSEISARVTEKVGESDHFHRVLQSMTVFRPPEGLNDTGTFELKPEYIDLVNPYYAHYSRNHREEAESICKKHLATKQGKKPEEVVFEPVMQPIPSGLFAGLSAVTATPLFVQAVRSALNFAAGVKSLPISMQDTRIETFLHMVLHLCLIATIQDEPPTEGFVQLGTRSRGKQSSVVSTLVSLLDMREYASCHATIKHILGKMHIKQPTSVSDVIGPLAAILDRANAGLTTSVSTEDKERKKKEALARQARVMAKMKQQQNSFLENQGLPAFGADDFEDEDDMVATSGDDGASAAKTWSFPTGTCIWCQEESNDHRLYGTFAFLGESRILRSTPVEDPDYVQEVMDLPDSLDRCADNMRPFGVAGNNVRFISKIGPDGNTVESQRQGLAKGFPRTHSGSEAHGVVATSCGHIMHYSCFETHVASTRRRHDQQVARSHPEAISLNEFTCPMCKALGNTFLPIVWKTKVCVHENELSARPSMSDWLEDDASEPELGFADNVFEHRHHLRPHRRAMRDQRCIPYVDAMILPPHAAKLADRPPTPDDSHVPPPRGFLDRGPAQLPAFFNRRSGRVGQIRAEEQANAPNPATRGRTSGPTSLEKAYRRIDETVSANLIDPQKSLDAANERSFIPLARSLGLSVTAMEIAQRGVGGDVHAASLLADLPEHTLTHLRILNETIESYLAVRVVASPNGDVLSRLTERIELLKAELFGADSKRLKRAYHWEHCPKPLLQEDTFLFFVDWLCGTSPPVGQAANIMQLCLWAEIVKTVLVYRKIVCKTAPERRADARVSLGFQDAVDDIGSQDERDPFGQISLMAGQASVLRHIVDKYALTFLRKCVVVMHVRYGLGFDSLRDVDPRAPELDRLTALLRMPSVDELCDVYGLPSRGGTRLRAMTKWWISRRHSGREESPPELTVPHPAIFELLGLPTRYDALTEEGTKHKCGSTGRELTDPTVCLLCGTMFCSQAVCCMRTIGKTDKGGCFQHKTGCGGPVGVFLNLRKCMVLFVHGESNGTWASAPYLDQHGEPDPTMRRHHPLFLHARRYDKLLREVWLAHHIPSVIARRLDADVIPGGWETL